MELKDRLQRNLFQKAIGLIKFNEFKYKSTLNQLNVVKQTALLFQEEIERIKTEYSAGQNFYPTLFETVHKLDSLIK